MTKENSVFEMEPKFKELNILQLGRGQESDNLYSGLLKELAHEGLAARNTVKPIKSGMVQYDWKTANVIPGFKKRGGGSDLGTASLLVGP